MLYLTGAATAVPVARTAAAMANVIFMSGSLKRTLILTASAFRRPAAANQLFDQPIAVIALDLDAAVAARAPGAAAFLEFRGERIQFIRRQAQPRDDRDALTAE